tara:strand:+ start:324 stop:596 length:273 start_codon:yes stop_codon:yes gene_type:complete
MSRAVSACILCPDNIIESIATSELISYVGPFIRYPPIDLNIIGFTMYLIYDPEYAYEIMKDYKQKDKVYYRIEFVCLMIFILNFILNRSN